MIYWIQILFGWLIGIPTGVGISFFIKFRKVDSEEDKIMPVINTSIFTSRRLLSAFVVLFFIGATAQIVTYTYTEREHWNHVQEQNEKQQKCNSEFRRVFTERSKTGAEDNALRIDNDNAALEAFTKLLTLNPADPGRTETVRRILQDYRDRLHRNNTKQTQNDKIRATNPYPDPRC